MKRQQGDSVMYRLIVQSDLPSLQQFLEKQNPVQVKYFNPHSFDLVTLRKIHKNPSFIMMGAFRDELIVGYFFLRCFFTRKCFIGRLVDEDYQRQGIARKMSDIMYHTAWNCGFKCMTTMSRNNQAIINLHDREGNTRILKNLPDNYLLVEILPP
jgi:GNAT superfamily N-acetyltransferase